MNTDPEWDEAAYDALADVWVEATPEEREEFERFVRRANRLIRDDPEHVGESRSGHGRVLIVEQLTFWFQPRPGTRALVFNVHRSRRRTP